MEVSAAQGKERRKCRLFSKREKIAYWVLLILGAAALLQSIRRAKSAQKPVTSWLRFQKVPQFLFVASEGKGKRGVEGNSSSDTPLKDFAVAISSHSGHADILAAGEAFRRAFSNVYIAVEEGSDLEPLKSASGTAESWGTYPDDNPKRSLYAGDSRLALAPFLANRKFNSTFQWMFFGDDDTVFFPRAARNVVAGLDPQQPIYLSDNFWYNHQGNGHQAYHPHRWAPVCLPCGFTGSEQKLRDLGYNMVAACPCTPETLCRKLDMEDVPYRGCARYATYGHHGGAGALISAGILQRMNFDSYHRCVKRTEAPGGDAMLGECLWQQGFPITAPDPLWHPFRLQMFSPSPEALNTDEHLVFKAAHVLSNILLWDAGSCEGLCELELQHTVSLHVRARSMGGSSRGAALFIQLFSRLSARLSGMLEPRELVQNQDDLSKEVDLEVDQAVEQLQQTIIAIRMSIADKLEREQEDLELSTLAGRVKLMDRVLRGAAKLVAMQILRGIRLKVEPFATDGSTFAYLDC